MHSAISELEHLGYTAREAAFLHLVGRNSGYFLRRQYCSFLRKPRGALAQQFVTKALKEEHISTVDCGQNRHVYHLNSRAIYRVLDMGNSPNCRPKRNNEITTWLLIIDYLLERLGNRWLSSEAEKVEFFQGELRIDQAHMPQFSVRSSRADRDTSARYFPNRFPIAVSQSLVETGRPLVRFTYFDGGRCTIQPFQSFLQSHQELFENLVLFDLDYVSLSPRNFVAAEHCFRLRFTDTGCSSVAGRLLPAGPDHLARFLAAEERWDRNDARFSQEDLAALREGEAIYTASEHAALRAAWRRGRAEFERQLRSYGAVTYPKARFSSCLIQQNYPTFGSRNTRTW